MAKKNVKKEKEVKETKKVEKEEVEETEEKDEFFEEQKQRRKDEKSLIYKIVNTFLWIVVFAWMAICLYDFFNVHQGKEPTFCIKKETTVYEDGTVDSCLGLGYKVYNYNRNSFKAIEFGPFWSKDRSAEEDND